jgi:hypothetical protein
MASRRDMEPAKVAELRAKDRARKEAKRVANGAAEYLSKLSGGGNYLIRETVGQHCRWTFADRSHGVLDPRYCEAAIRNQFVRLVKRDGLAEFYGTRDIAA